MDTLPFNPISGAEYQGANIDALVTGQWATFIQWQSIGRLVKKGEHGRKIVRLIDIENVKDGKPIKDAAMRLYTVFEISQTQESTKREAAEPKDK